PRLPPLGIAECLLGSAEPQIAVRFAHAVALKDWLGLEAYSMSRLWPPAAAITSARLGMSCPRTSARSSGAPRALGASRVSPPRGGAQARRGAAPLRCPHTSSR